MPTPQGQPPPLTLAGSEAAKPLTASSVRTTIFSYFGCNGSIFWGLASTEARQRNACRGHHLAIPEGSKQTSQRFPQDTALERRRHVPSALYSLRRPPETAKQLPGWEQTHFSQHEEDEPHRAPRGATQVPGSPPVLDPCRQPAVPETLHQGLADTQTHTPASPHPCAKPLRLPLWTRVWRPPGGLRHGVSSVPPPEPSHTSSHAIGPQKPFAKCSADGADPSPPQPGDAVVVRNWQHPVSPQPGHHLPPCLEPQPERGQHRSRQRTTARARKSKFFHQ